MKKLAMTILLLCSVLTIWAQGERQHERVELTMHRIDAKLDGRIPINIVWQQLDDLLAGYIYYPKAKHPAPILIAGGVTTYDGKDYYYLKEYQDDGTITGIITLTTNSGNASKVLEATWTNPKTDKEMSMSSIAYSHKTPTWFAQSPLIAEDPGNIGREYSFQKWDIMYGSMMGGHISFKAAGKNKVHFECCNARHNIAEGQSEQGRPAVLKGNTFEYRDVNECGYAFRATFFQRFVHLKTISDNESLGCFGSGAAFDGVYIKVKQ